MYPGPEYLVTGESGECAHGVPESAPCADCLSARVRVLEAENERLEGWLALIEGGDSPCADAAALRLMAYQALTLKRDVPDDAQ